MLLANGQFAQPVDQVVQSTSTDRGGTITTANTSQVLAPANPARRGFTIQNQSTGNLYINGLTAATADYHSLLIPAGAMYESRDVHSGTGVLNIIGPTAGQAFYCREF